MNCIEAIYYFKLKNNVLIIYFDRRSVKSIKQIENAKKSVDWKSVTYINRPKTRWEYYLFPVVIKKRLRRFRKNVYTIFIGYPDNFITHIVNVVNPVHTYLVDDGAAALRLGYSCDLTFIDYGRRWKQLLLGYKIRPYKFTWFTAYKNTMTGIPVTVNSYEYFRKNLQVREIGNYAVFIGQPLYVNDFLSVEVYSQAITKALSDCNCSCLLYIPHRHEFDLSFIEQVDKNNSNVKLKVVEPDSNIESWLKDVERLPKCIYNIYSSAVVTINLIFPSIEIKCLKLPDDTINNIINKERYSLVVKEYVEQGLKFFDFVGGDSGN
jgi:hypothetical protein